VDVCRGSPGLRPLGGGWERSGNHERLPGRFTAPFRSLVRGFTCGNMDLTLVAGISMHGWGAKGSPVLVRQSRDFKPGFGPAG
jgi:hypothetical protein